MPRIVDCLLHFAVCSWVVDELVDMGLQDKAKILERFWDNGAGDVQNIIRACFGHPHRDYIGLNWCKDAPEMKYQSSE
jgi:hypothetical protein